MQNKIENWSKISQELVTKEFLSKNRNQVNWTHLAHSPFVTEELVRHFFQEFAKQNTQNKFIKWSPLCMLLMNKNLHHRFSEAFIAENIDILRDQNLLCLLEDYPFSQDFIDKNYKHFLGHRIAKKFSIPLIDLYNCVETDWVKLFKKGGLTLEHIKELTLYMPLYSMPTVVLNNLLDSGVDWNQDFNSSSIYREIRHALTSARPHKLRSYDDFFDTLSKKLTSVRFFRKCQ